MWIESHQSLRNHPKVKKAARIAGINEFEMIGRLHAFWWWAMDYAPDGDLTKYTNDDIEDAVDWTGEKGLFVKSLIECSFNGNSGLIDVVGKKSRKIHDWYEYAGKLIERRAEDAERKRNGRTKNIRRTSAGHPQEISQTAYVPNQPNQPNQQTEQESSPDGESVPDKPKRKPTERDTAVDTLESRFVALSGLPKPSRDSGKSGSATRWWNPLREIWEMCGKDTDKAASIIEKAYRKMIADELTISAPQSVLEVAKSVYAQNGHGTQSPRESAIEAALARSFR